MTQPDQLHEAQAIADGIEHELDPRYLMLQRRRGWVNAAVYSGIWFVIATLAGVLGNVAGVRSPVPAEAMRWILPLWGLWAIAYTIWGQVRPRLAYRHARYRVDARGIEIRDGILVRRVISVPRSRVQHIDVAQGPFDRRYDIATLSIYTAGVTHAMVVLPGLAHDRALRIRDYLLPHGGDGAY